MGGRVPPRPPASPLQFKYWLAGQVFATFFTASDSFLNTKNLIVVQCFKLILGILDCNFLQLFLFTCNFLLQFLLSMAQSVSAI